MDRQLARAIARRQHYDTTTDPRAILPDRPLPLWIAKRREQKAARRRAADPRAARRAARASEAGPSAAAAEPVDDDLWEAAAGDRAFLKLDQAKLPLAMFDDHTYAEADRTPEEWVRSGSGAQALHFADQAWTWRRCRVLGYDAASQRFRIQFCPAGKTKRVGRLNIVFDGEDRARWAARRAAADAARDEAKRLMRFDHFLEQLPARRVQPMRSSVLRGIHSRVVHGLAARASLPEPATPAGLLLARLTEEVVHGYGRSVKIGMVRERLGRDALYRARYAALRLPELRPPRTPPELGKVPVPRHRYEENRAAVERAHASSSARVLRLFRWLARTWEDDLSGARLVRTDLPRAELPCRLDRFRELQRDHAAAIRGKLQLRWRRAFADRLADSAQDDHDFFVADESAFRSSALARLLRHFELRMMVQLRHLVLTTACEWRATVEGYAAAGGDDPHGLCGGPAGSRGGLGGAPGTAFFEVELVVTKAGDIAVSPGLPEVEEALTEVLDSAVATVRALTFVDADLMSLLHLEARRILNLGGGDELCRDVDEALAHAKASIAAWVSRPAARLRAVVQLLQRHAWIAKLDASFLERFVAETPPSDSASYCAEARRLHEAARAVERETQDAERLGLLRVVASKAKALLVNRALAHRDELLAVLVSDCKAQALTVIERYRAILARVAEAPSDEGELRALRDFIEGIGESVAALSAEAADVHRRLDALDEFHFRVSEEDSVLAWSMRTFPRHVAAAVDAAEERLARWERHMVDELALEQEKLHGMLASFEHGIALAKGLDDEEEDDEGAGAV